MHVKKGDNVIVIAGKDKGKSGVIERVFPKKNLVLIPGFNVVKKHARGNQKGKGQIVDKPMPFHASNVKIQNEVKKAKKTKVSKAK